MSMVDEQFFELVDFEALQLDPSSDKYDKLLLNVAELLGLASERCDVDLLEAYDTVLIRLAAVADPVMRAEVASRLAILRRVPGGIVRTLALDEIDIAQPLLICSPALTDDDLIAICQIRADRHRRAVAMRPNLSERVCSVILEQGNESVRRTLAGNATARLSKECYERLIEQAETDTALQSILAERVNLPAWVKSTLKDKLGKSWGESVDRREASRKARRVARAAAAGEWTLRVEAMFGDYDVAAAEERLKHANGDRSLDIAAIAAMAERNEFAEVAVALAQASGFQVSDVLGWFANRDTDIVLFVLRSLGATVGQCRTVLRAGPWRYFVSNDERARAINQYERLDEATASAVVEQRRKERRAA